MRDAPKPRPRDREQHTRDHDDDHGLQTFWQWFAVGVLLLCWIAEATLCAERGF